MKYREFNQNGEKVSLLGLGCMRFPKVTPDKEEIDVPAACEIIDYAYNNGVNYFDTAFPYHGGQSELVIGEALKKYPRDSFKLATKLPMWKLQKKEDVLDTFNEQLKKCQVEYFDFYLCHAMNRERMGWLEKYEVMPTLFRLKEEGKIRHLGFSFHDTPDVLEELLNRYQWDFVQIQLNYLDWELQDAKRQYELIAGKGLQAVIMEPVRGGMLASLCEEADQVFKEAEPEHSVASWALRFAMSLPKVLTVLSGMSNMDQVIDNVQTAGEFEPLTDEQRGVIDAALEEFKKNKTIPCTGCRYCMDCPAGVNIPKIFKIYNDYAISKNKNGFKRAYEELPESERADRCVECGACMSQCPQSLKVPERMKEIAAMAAEMN
jgi:predicted aldo/keto reductase-like oxidoreductase